jgi:hypothetical protein
MGIEPMPEVGGNRRSRRLKPVIKTDTDCANLNLIGHGTLESLYK